MKNAIILHGVEDNVADYHALPVTPAGLGWYPKIAGELSRRGVSTHVPDMPKPYIPDMDYNQWATTIAPLSIGTQTILIGHSCGAGFWLKYLSVNPQIHVGQLILVAPWTDVEQAHPTFFANWTIDKTLPERCGRIDVFYSGLDDESILQTVDTIRTAFGQRAHYYQMDDKGHFNWGLIGDNFPEILDVIVP